MRRRPPRVPATLEVHVQFETNRLASAHLADAYEQLIPVSSVKKPPASEPVPASSREPLLLERKPR